MTQSVKNPPAEGLGSIPELGGSPGEGNDYPFQYSCLENPMDRRAWWAIDQGVTKSQTQLSNEHFGWINPQMILGASQVVERTHLPMQETQARSLGQEDPLEKGMATHSSILA